MLLATIDVCKSLDTARSSNPSPPSIIGSARCMSYNMSYDMSYPEHLALHNSKYFRPRTVCTVKYQPWLQLAEPTYLSSLVAELK